MLCIRLLLYSGLVQSLYLNYLIKPLYEQGFIVVPHLGTLGFSIGRGGEIRSIYSYFLSSALHLICSAFLSLGGIYHAIFGRG